MQVNPVTSNRSASAASDPTDPGTVPIVTKKQTLGQDDFLKLLAVQFQSQDPMKPMEDTAFIAQMAQFTALDQSKSLLSEVTAMNAKQDFVTANSYIGRHVTLDAGDDGLVSGDVSGVDTSDGTPRLILGDKSYSLSSVLLVEPGTAPATQQTQPATSGT